MDKPIMNKLYNLCRCNKRRGKNILDDNHHWDSRG